VKLDTGQRPKPDPEDRVSIPIFEQHDVENPCHKLQRSTEFSVPRAETLGH